MDKDVKKYIVCDGRNIVPIMADRMKEHDEGLTFYRGAKYEYVARFRKWKWWKLADDSLLMIWDTGEIK